MEPASDDLDEIADRLEAAQFELLALLGEVEQLVADTAEVEQAAVWLKAMREAAGADELDRASVAPTFAATIADLRAQVAAANNTKANR